MRLRLAKGRDLGFEFGDDRVEQRDFPGVLTLLVLAEAEEVGFVLGTPAVEVFAVFLVDESAALFDLGPVASGGEVGDGIATGKVGALRAVDIQDVTTLR